MDDMSQDECENDSYDANPEKILPTSFPNKDIIEAENSFGELEKCYQKTLAELESDQEFDHLKMVFEQIHAALLEKHRNEKELMNTKTILEAQVEAYAVQTALNTKLLNENKLEIEYLKKEIRNAWNSVQTTLEELQLSKEIAEQYREEIKSIMNRAECFSSDATGKALRLVELKEIEEILNKKCSNREEKIDFLQEQLQQKEYQLDDMCNQLRSNKGNLIHLENQIKLVKLEKSKEEIQKNENERKLRCTENLLKQLESKLGTVKNQVSKKENEILRMVKSNNDLEECNTSMRRELDILQNNFYSNKKELFDRNMQNNLLLTEILTKNEELEEKQRKINVTEGQLKKVNLEKNNIQGSLLPTQLILGKTQSQNKSLEQKASEAEKVNKALQREIDTKQKHVDSLESRILFLERLRGSTRASYTTHTSMTKALEENNVKLKNKVNQLERLVNSKNKQISQLSIETEQLKIASSKCNETIEIVKSESTHKDLTVKHLEHTIRELMNEKKCLTRLLQSWKRNYSNCQKRIIDVEKEVDIKVKKLDITHHLLDQLHLELHTKCSDNSHQDKELRKSESQLCSLRKIHSNYKTQISDLKEKIFTLTLQNEALRSMMLQADEEMKKFENQSDISLVERKLVETKLNQKNDQLSILRSQLSKKNLIFQKSLRDIEMFNQDLRLLKIGMKKIWDLKNKLSRNIRINTYLKKEIIKSQKLLINEQHCNAQLSDQLQCASNIHRWRRLQGSDPTKMKLICKVHGLQKQLLKCKETITERNSKVETQNLEITRLKRLMERMPDQEVLSKLSEYKSEIREKNDKILAMTAEINMYTTKATKCEETLSTYSNEIKTLKIELQKTQRRKAMTAEARKPSCEVKKENKTKSLGGGFYFTIGK